MKGRERPSRTAGVSLLLTRLPAEAHHIWRNARRSLHCPLNAPAAVSGEKSSDTSKPWAAWDHYDTSPAVGTLHSGAVFFLFFNQGPARR